MTIGVFADGRLVQRPYSVASTPRVAGTEGYEFYVRLVQGGMFTPLLWRLPIGHRMRMIGPKGKFMLEPDDDRTHVFISSGTGNAPFVSMMKTMLLDGHAAAGGVPQRRLVRGRARLPRARSRTGRRRATYPVTLRPDGLAADDPENAGWTGRSGRVGGDRWRPSATSSA